MLSISIPGTYPYYYTVCTCQITILFYIQWYSVNMRNLKTLLQGKIIIQKTRHHGSILVTASFRHIMSALSTFCSKICTWWGAHDERHMMRGTWWGAHDEGHKMRGTLWEAHYERHMMRGTWWEAHAERHMLRGTWWEAHDERHMMKGTWWGENNQRHMMRGTWWGAHDERHM